MHAPVTSAEVGKELRINVEQRKDGITWFSNAFLSKYYNTNTIGML
jgi:hypothetical protein